MNVEIPDLEEAGVVPDGMSVSDHISSTDYIFQITDGIPCTVHKLRVVCVVPKIPGREPSICVEWRGQDPASGRSVDLGELIECYEDLDDSPKSYNYTVDR